MSTARIAARVAVTSSSGRARRVSAFVLAVLGLLVFVLMWGCAPAPSGPHVDTVRRYVAALPAALHGDTLAGLREVATEEQIDLVRRYVAYVLNNGERMDSKVTALSVREAQLQGNSASVTTDEVWAVVYRDAQDGEVARTEDYRMKVRYSLVLQDGSWLVSDVEELERTAR